MTKETFLLLLGTVGATITSMLGGWDNATITLLWFMLIDYIMGLIVAGIFKRSKKSKTGALSSNASWKGLCKKFASLLFVIIGYRVDLLIGTNFVKDAVVISFICNEAISIFENAGLMGVPIPDKLKKAIEVLRKDNQDVQ